MVMVPLRWPEFGFAATVKPTAPLPCPLLPEVTVIKEELLRAVQEQALSLGVILTIPVLPLTPKFWLAGAMLKLQPDCNSKAPISVPSQPVAFGTEGSSKVRAKPVPR